MRENVSKHYDSQWFLSIKQLKLNSIEIVKIPFR
jgi:hypothetical protein